jgi:bacillithiol biosynthesis cysteine-adding enzyme BshC
MSRLFEDYIAGKPEVRALFGPEPESLNARAPAGRPWDGPLAEALQALQLKLGLQREFRGDEAVIVTGQQPGLFLGPMYTLYKAVTAVALARRMRERHGIACVPVFWVASEDHDFDEVRWFAYTDAHGQLVREFYTPRDAQGEPVDIAGLPMHKVPVDGELFRFVDRLAARGTASDQSAEVTALLRDTLSQAASVSNWFARLMAALFKDTDLVIFAPHMRTARVAAAPVIRREIEAPLASTALLAKSAKRLESLGYAPPILKAASACNFFLNVNGRRRKVVFEKGRFMLPEEDCHILAQEEMLALLDAAPERFSPNVALRPVVQQVLFPAAAYVAGPGEIAYWAQLKPVFDHHGITMPAVWPRARALMITPKERRKLAAGGLTVEDLALPEEMLLNRALDTEAPAPLTGALEQHRVTVDSQLAALIQELAGAATGPNAVALAEEMRRQAARGFERIAGNLLRGDARRVEDARKRLAVLRNRLAPFGKPQERVLSPFNYLLSQGLGFVDRLLNELDPEDWRVREIEWL